MYCVAHTRKRPALKSFDRLISYCISVLCRRILMRLTIVLRTLIRCHRADSSARLRRRRPSRQVPGAAKTIPRKIEQVRRGSSRSPQSTSSSFPRSHSSYCTTSSSSDMTADESFGLASQGRRPRNGSLGKSARPAWEPVPDYLVRDRDRVYGEAFTRRIRATGIRDRPTAPRSPWQNGYAERLIGSIRRECLDHVIVLGERHLRHVLGAYQQYYNGTRTHLALAKDSPLTRSVQAIGSILPLPILGGLHHHYVRI